MSSSTDLRPHERVTVTQPVVYAATGLPARPVVYAGHVDRVTDRWVFGTRDDGSRFEARRDVATIAPEPFCVAWNRFPADLARPDTDTIHSAYDFLHTMGAPRDTLTAPEPHGHVENLLTGADEFEWRVYGDSAKHGRIYVSLRAERA